MLKKTIKWKNLFTDEEESGEFYFHLNKGELIEMEVSHQGGLAEYFTQLAAAEDALGIVNEIRKLILVSYGQKDGSSFVKSPELRDKFERSEAFSELLMEVSTDAERAADFVNGIVPKDLEEDIARLTEKEKKEKEKKKPKAE